MIRSKVPRAITESRNAAATHLATGSICTDQLAGSEQDNKAATPLINEQGYMVESGLGRPDTQSGARIRIFKYSLQFTTFNPACSFLPLAGLKRLIASPAKVIFHQLAVRLIFFCL